MDLNILKQIIILKLTIWFYRRQWMRERGGEGEREIQMLYYCFPCLLWKVTIMNYNNGLYCLTRLGMKTDNELLMRSDSHRVCWGLYSFSNEWSVVVPIFTLEDLQKPVSARLAEL